MSSEENVEKSIDATMIEHARRKIVKSLGLPAAPTLGFDLDGCIDECPVFFQLLALSWPGKVIVVTYRDDLTKAAADLEKHEVRYDELILVSSLEEKAEVLTQKGVLVYFDDQPEVLKHVPETINVMLVRNGGNYDYDTSRWVMSDKTAMILGGS